MSEKQKEILENLGKAMNSLSETDKERVVAFAEGAAFVANNRAKKENVAAAEG